MSIYINPWNELNPYQEGQTIYGRSPIISKLTDAIYTNLQTVLYGKSGIGKTSLLQAGCFPELRKLHFFPIVIRPGIMESSSDYVATIIDIIKNEAVKVIPGIKPSLLLQNKGNTIFTNNRLCQFLYSTQFLDKIGTPFIPILIFDQFEEFINNKRIFNNAVNFVKELYVLLDNTVSVPSGFLDYSNYRLVFALREDYLYCLEDIIDRYYLNELRYNRHRITALTENQAKSVIENTFRSSIPDISPDKLKRITETIIPIAKEANEYADIRTPILSLLGSLIFKQIIDNRGIDAINTNHELYLYYDEIISNPTLSIEVRWFLEKKLITIDGRRDSMDYQSALLTHEIDEEQIDFLVRKKKILNLIEVGSGERRLEFAHDIICKALKPVIEMREHFFKVAEDLYFKSYDDPKLQPVIVRYFSYATDLGHCEASYKLKNLYNEGVQGILDDRDFKAKHTKRERLIVLLNGGEWGMEQLKSPANSQYKYDIFMSYSRFDQEFATILSRDLSNVGCSIWMDINGIESGQEFARVIMDAIKESNTFLLLCSKNAYDSRFIIREMEYAIALQKRIIPIIIDDTPMPHRFLFRLSNINYLSIKHDDWKEKLIRDIRQLKSVDKKSNNNITTTEKIVIMLDDYPIDLVRIEGGRFTMGATIQQGGDNLDERVVHNVHLDTYYIATVPVTQELWKRVMGKKTTGRSWNNKLGKIKGFNINYNCPVVNVSWDECMTFIENLNRLTGKEFRLPTESEWEYAAKGGAKGRYNGFKYSGSNNPHIVSWHFENSDGEIHEVAQKQPNEVGIYDMSGNVWEWCSDWYGAYQQNTLINPKGPDQGEKKVCRGGSFTSIGRNCRISMRESEYPDERSVDIGFRLAL